MITGLKNNGSPVLFFNEECYRNNIQNNGTWISFTSGYTEFTAKYKLKSDSYIIPEENYFYDYFDKFCVDVPSDSYLYFDKSSKFPRTKLTVANIKRTIKPQKADLIVLKDKARVIITLDVYNIFTDGIDIFVINDNAFNSYFHKDLKDLYNNQHALGVGFKDALKMIYSGKLTIICDPDNTLKKFKELNDKRFIVDFDLNRVVNDYLPDPTLDELLAIKDMINSSDRNIIKLGALMASGYNINKGLLTFQCLLGLNRNGMKAENGGSSNTIKQVSNTLNYNYMYSSGFWSLSRHVSTLKYNYLNEDIALAKNLIRTYKPQIEKFCKEAQHFYIADLPFIPDEYKK